MEHIAFSGFLKAIVTEKGMLSLENKLEECKVEKTVPLGETMHHGENVKHFYIEAYVVIDCGLTSEVILPREERIWDDEQCERYRKAREKVIAEIQQLDGVELVMQQTGFQRFNANGEIDWANGKTVYHLDLVNIFDTLDIEK